MCALLEANGHAEAGEAGADDDDLVVLLLVLHRTPSGCVVLAEQEVTVA